MSLVIEKSERLPSNVTFFYFRKKIVAKVTF